MATGFAMVGRWMTPDLLGGDITNPQSLNRYAYALNNPTTLTDPMGLDPCTILGQLGECVTSTSTPADQPPFYIGPCSYEAIEFAACYGGWSPAPPGWVPFSPPGGTSTGPPPAPKPAPPAPSLIQRIANVAQCAAPLANTLSAANLTGLNKNSITNTLFSNVFSSATDLVFGTNPNEYLPGGASVVASTKGMNLVSRGLAAGAAKASSTEVDPGLQFIFSNVPATTLGETLLGKGLVSISKAGTEFFSSTLTIYDAGIFTGAVAVCALQ